MARKEEVEEGERDKMKRSEKREVAKMMESVALVLSFAAVGEEMLMAGGWSRWLRYELLRWSRCGPFRVPRNLRSK